MSGVFWIIENNIIEEDIDVIWVEYSESLKIILLTSFYLFFIVYKKKKKFSFNNNNKKRRRRRRRRRRSFLSTTTTRTRRRRRSFLSRRRRRYRCHMSGVFWIIENNIIEEDIGRRRRSFLSRTRRRRRRSFLSRRRRRYRCHMSEVFWIIENNIIEEDIDVIWVEYSESLKIILLTSFYLFFTVYNGFNMIRWRRPLYRGVYPWGKSPWTPSWTASMDHFEDMPLSLNKSRPLLEELLV
jgi:hypothetical protein